MKIVVTWLAVCIFVIPALGFNEEDAAEQWGSAYVWLQTGRNLTTSGQSPLALGSFVEALKQFELVAENYPDYETKMVNYRIEALRADIAKLNADLTPEDLAIAREYISFIKLVEQAEEERFSAQREKALETLRLARAGLDAIVARRPEAFGPAVKDQDLRLAGSIEWLDKIVSSRKGTMAMRVTHTGGAIKGTTEFITESDLPGTPGLVASGKSLFPGR